MKAIAIFLTFIAFVFTPFIWGYHAQSSCQYIPHAPSGAEKQPQMVIG